MITLVNQKGFIPIIFILGILIITGSIIGGSFYIKSLKSSKLQPQNVVIASPTLQPTPSSLALSSPRTEVRVIQEELIYQPPCETGDKKGCIMEKAYAKLHKSSAGKDYTIIWDEAFKICESYPNDSSILFDQEQCKMDICTGLSSGDGNLKYTYPEREICRRQVLPLCKDGNIIENIPCACDVPAGPFAAYTKYWLDDYWNKYRKNDAPIYCCSGKQQDTQCNIKINSNTQR